MKYCERIKEVFGVAWYGLRIYGIRKYGVDIENVVEELRNEKAS